MLWRQSFCKDATVRKIMLNNGVLRGTKYDGKEVYLVDFPPDETPTIGGIGVYISTDTNIAFKQVCKDKGVNKFLEKCINVANKHIGTFTTLLLKEDFHLPHTFESEITNSNVAPFSDKLMLFHSGFLFAAAISYYSSAAITSMRADIAIQCEKAILDDLLVYSSFGKLIIKKNWMEQPPNADDRKIINE